MFKLKRSEDGTIQNGDVTSMAQTTKVVSKQKVPTQHLYRPINNGSCAFDQALNTIFNCGNSTLTVSSRNLQNVFQRLKLNENFSLQINANNIFTVTKNGMLSSDILRQKIITQLLIFLVKNFDELELDCVNYTQSGFRFDTMSISIFYQNSCYNTFLFINPRLQNCSICIFCIHCC